MGTSGQLNPDWVETLMGYPVGWTNPDKVNDFDYFNKRSIWDVFSQLWPARRGEPQYEWEPLRTKKRIKKRVARIRMLGNAVVPQWAFIPLAIISELHRLRRTPPGSTGTRSDHGADGESVL